MMLMCFLDVNDGSALRGAFAAAGRRIPYANGYIGKVVIAGGQGRKAYTDIAFIGRAHGIRIEIVCSPSAAAFTGGLLDSD